MAKKKVVKAVSQEGEEMVNSKVVAATVNEDHQMATNLKNLNDLLVKQTMDLRQQLAGLNNIKEKLVLDLAETQLMAKAYMAERDSYIQKQRDSEEAHDISRALFDLERTMNACIVSWQISHFYEESQKWKAHLESCLLQEKEKRSALLESWKTEKATLEATISEGKDKIFCMVGVQESLRKSWQTERELMGSTIASQEKEILKINKTREAKEESWKRKKEELQRTIWVLKGQVSEEARSNEQSKKRIDEQNLCLAELREDVLKLNQAITTLNESHQDLVNTNNQIRRELLESEDAHGTLSSQREELSRKIQKLEEDVENKDRLLNCLKEDSKRRDDEHNVCLTQLKENVINLNQTLTSLNESHQDLVNTNQQIRRELLESEGARAMLSSQKEELSKNVQKLEEDVENKDRLLNCLKEDSKSRDDEHNLCLTQMREDVINLRQRLVFLNESHQDLVNINNQIRRELLESEGSHGMLSSEKEELSRKVQKIEEDVANKDHLLNCIEVDIKKKDDEHNVCVTLLKEDVINLNQALTSLNESHQDLVNTDNQIRRELLESENACAMLSSQNEELSRKIEQLGEDVEKKDILVNYMEEDKKKRNDEHNQCLIQLRVDVINLNQTITDLNHSHKELVKENNKIREELQRSKDAYGVASSQNQELNKKILKLEVDVENKDVLIKRLKKEMNVVEEEGSEWRKRFEDAKACGDQVLNMLSKTAEALSGYERGELRVAAEITDICNGVTMVKKYEEELEGICVSFKERSDKAREMAQRMEKMSAELVEYEKKAGMNGRRTFYSSTGAFVAALVLAFVVKL